MSLIKHPGEATISLRFAVEAGNDTEDDFGRLYRPLFVTVTIGTYVNVRIAAVKIKKDGTNSVVTCDPFHSRNKYPPFVHAAIEATQDYILKAQEAQR